MALRDDLKERVQAATDIVRLVGEQVALKPKGREFVGLCPFHDDKSPSMYVSPAKQIYKCFACGVGGDVFSFQMGYHKMTFPEALRHLAEKAGIEIDDAAGATSAAGETASDRKRLATANGQALDFFRRMLLEDAAGQVARGYVDRRGISPEMVTDFQLGYAPDRWDGLVATISQKRWDLQAFELGGLVKRRNAGNGHFDILRHRLIFPICDGLGRPIAFGGRKLRDEDEPKYLNSPETPLFNKSRTLYGLHLAKKPIIDSRTAVIVEGYVDVIACHQAGFRNVVATLGTALTAEHVAELRRFAEKVVLIFDADAAGERAADRAVELFLTGDVDVAIAEIPHGPNGSKMDPADLMALEEGPDLWRAAIEGAQDALAYQFERVRGRLDAAGTVTGRQRVAEDYLRTVGQLGLARSGAIRRSLVIQRLSGLLHLAEPQVDALLKASSPRPRPAATGMEPAPANAAGDSPVPARENNATGDVAGPETGSRLKAVRLAERQLIGCLLKDTRLFTEPLADGRALDEALPPELFTDGSNRRLYRMLYERLSESHAVTLAGLLGDLAAEGETDLASLATQCDADADKVKGEQTSSLLRQVAGTVLDYHEERRYAEERRRIATESDTAFAAKAGQLLDPLRSTPKPRITIFRG